MTWRRTFLNGFLGWQGSFNGHYRLFQPCNLLPFSDYMSNCGKSFLVCCYSTQIIWMGTVFIGILITITKSVWLTDLVLVKKCNRWFWQVSRDFLINFVYPEICWPPCTALIHNNNKWKITDHNTLTLPFKNVEIFSFLQKKNVHFSEKVYIRKKLRTAQIHFL